MMPGATGGPGRSDAVERCTWQEVENYLEGSKGILLPVGSTEQHGPNGLIGTDAICAELVARGVGEATGAMVAPTLNFGMAQHHMAFRGTMTLRPQTLLAVLVDLLNSLAQHGFERCLVINGHGGNMATIAAAFSELHAAASLNVENRTSRLRCRMRNWWGSPAVSELQGSCSATAMAATTASEISVTQYACPEAIKRMPMSPPLAPPSSGFTDAADFRRRYPDGRIGSGSFARRPRARRASVPCRGRRIERGLSASSWPSLRFRRAHAGQMDLYSATEPIRGSGVSWSRWRVRCARSVMPGPHEECTDHSQPRRGCAIQASAAPFDKRSRAQAQQVACGRRRRGLDALGARGGAHLPLSESAISRSSGVLTTSDKDIVWGSRPARRSSMPWISCAIAAPSSSGRTTAGAQTPVFGLRNLGACVARRLPWRITRTPFRPSVTPSNSISSAASASSRPCPSTHSRSVTVKVTVMALSLATLHSRSLAMAGSSKATMGSPEDVLVPFEAEAPLRERASGRLGGIAERCGATGDGRVVPRRP